MPTLRSAVSQAEGIERRDAERLLAHVLGHDRVWLLAHAGDALAPADFDAFQALCRRRAAGEPLQYLLQTQEFYGMNITVRPGVLIPRPETEGLVEAVVQWTAARSGARLRLLDVGTGSGAVALALAASLPAAEITAVDLSPEALEIASENARRLGLGNRLRFLQSDLLSAVAGERFDAVVSNPPYVPLTDRDGIQPEVRDHEPALALFAGDDGLEIYRRLIPAAWQALESRGLLAMEFGFGQREALRTLLAGWTEVEFRNDLAGIPRIVTGLR